jgi:hypothetical protein
LPVARRSSITASASAARSSGKRSPTIGLTKPASISGSIAAPICRFTSGLPITYAPQPAPTTSVFLRSSRFTRTSGIEPPVKPTTTQRPPSASERRLSVKRSPPTGSSTTSTPPSQIAVAWSFQSGSERITSSAPAARATSSFSSLDTTAIVFAPSPFATWMPAVPTPPAAPWISTVSPSSRRPRSFRAK